MTEGFLSLARAFIYGGARSVVGSQWDVNDRSSARLVGRFYAGLAGGRRVAAALRDAQLEIAGPNPYATSAHWAGFIVAGDPQADPRLRPGSAPARSARHDGRRVLFAFLTWLGWHVARVRRPASRQFQHPSLLLR